MTNPEGSALLILASASPRRQELLTLASVQFVVVPRDADETARPGESPGEHVRRLARAKAARVAERHAGRWVLAADTAVVIDERILGKPRDPREAEEMLRLLSGRVHEVLTGYCLLRFPSGGERERTVSSRVSFKDLSAEEIRRYTRTEEPYDKAGGYAIQGRAAYMIREIQGSYTNVVGLPLCEVMEDLQELGAIRL
jgi:septum formation protein